MISKDELANILSQEEGSRLEFKKSAHFADRIGRSICAFANSGGGLLILGVEKTNEKTIISGLAKDEAYQKIAAILPKMDPRPQIIYEEHSVDGKLIIVVNVNAMQVSEVCFFEKNVYIRQGSVNVEIYKQQLVEFLRARGVISFEENRSNAKITNLSEEKIKKHLLRRMGKDADANISIETILQSLGVANAVGDFYIKNVAVLAFAKDISHFFSNIEIRVVKYKGKIAMLEAREFDQRYNDTVPELLENVFSIIREKAGFSARIIDGKRVEISMIPDDVLREAITNAVGHRDYFDPNGILVEILDDRIQITNPGTLLPGQNLRNFADIRRHRNPILHRILNDAGCGEGMNLGVRAMIRILREQDLPDPVFEDFGGFFRVILYGPLSDRAVKKYGQLNEKQEKALTYLGKHDSITAPQFASMVGVSHPTAIQYLNDLVAQGHLKKTGNYRSSRYVKDRKD